MAEPSRRLVIGIGNPDRGDDGAGRLVARQLRGTLPDAVEALEHSGEATSLLAHLETAAGAWLVDACTSPAAAGTVRRFDVVAAPLPQDAMTLSSHGMGLNDAIELARVLGQLPRRCIVYTIDAEQFETGQPPSQAVITAARDVSDRIRRELDDAPKTMETNHA